MDPLFKKYLEPLFALLFSFDVFVRKLANYDFWDNFSSELGVNLSFH